jgi:hypothetical protein
MPSADVSVIQELHESGVSEHGIARRLGVSHGTVHYWIGRIKGGNGRKRRYLEHPRFFRAPSFSERAKYLDVARRKLQETGGTGFFCPVCPLVRLYPLEGLLRHMDREHPGWSHRMRLLYEKGSPPEAIAEEYRGIYPRRLVDLVLSNHVQARKLEVMALW